MEFHRLGNTELSVSRIGFGCGPASGYDYGPIDETEWRDAVRAALDKGVNFFDVADVYGFGRAEELLADALGERRHSMVIATKCGLRWDSTGKVRRDLSRQSILSALHGSLRRLHLEAIPLYQIHWPDPAVPIEDAIAVLARCREAGKIRFIGVGNFPLELLARANSVLPLECHQVAFSLLFREPERKLFSWCDSRNISNVAHTGLARGLLAGRGFANGFHYTDTRRQSPYFSDLGREEKQDLVSALRQIAADSRKPLSSVALRWILDHPQITSVLVGIKSRSQAEENIEAVDWRLTSETHYLLSRLSSACPEGLAGVPAHAAV